MIGPLDDWEMFENFLFITGLEVQRVGKENFAFLSAHDSDHLKQEKIIIKLN